MHRITRLSSSLLLALVASVATADGRGSTPQQLVERGLRHEHGEGVARDPQQAYRLYCLAALQGSAEAMYRLGWLYLNGRGVTRDDRVAKGWLTRARDGGDRYAARLLEHLPSTRPLADAACPALDPARPSRQQIERWVRLLAPDYGLDPELVLAVIATESSFDARALSAKNAHGLMQLLPRTAQRFGVADIWHPIDNLRGGMAYLEWLMDEFRGDLRLSLAAYNAGEQAVQRHGGVPPYDETRRYVRRILSRYRGSTL